MTMHVDGRCSGCGSCLATCPSKAIVATPGALVIADERCSECLACVEVCPTDAINLSRPTHAINLAIPNDHTGRLNVIALRQLL